MTGALFPNGLHELVERAAPSRPERAARPPHGTVKDGWVFDCLLGWVSPELFDRRNPVVATAECLLCGREIELRGSLPARGECCGIVHTAQVDGRIDQSVKRMGVL